MVSDIFQIIATMFTCTVKRFYYLNVWQKHILYMKYIWQIYILNMFNNLSLEPNCCNLELIQIITLALQ